MHLDPLLAAYLTFTFILAVTPVSAAGSGESADERRASFRQGLAANLLNPAVSTFYLVVVPSFLPPGAPRWYYAVLASMHIAIAFSCHGAWALAFDHLA